MVATVLRRLSLLLLLLVAACSGEPPRSAAAPALWAIAGPHGDRGWLFGTVHALPPDLAWETAALKAALGRADRLVLEIAQPANGTAAHAAFLRLGTTPGQPALTARVPPPLRAPAQRLARAGGIDEATAARLEDWALALALAQAATRQGRLDTAHGVEAVLRRRGLPVEGLETAAGQLALFDRLEPSAQRALLAAVVAESTRDGLAERLIAAWAGGDIAAIAREAQGGMLAEPRLRQALLVARNQAWAARIDADLRAGKRPFVAVGAAHVAGPDGLPALLAARGWSVRRLQ